MTQIYEIWERQADRYYEMKKYLDETDKKVDRVQDRILYNDLKLIALRFSIAWPTCNCFRSRPSDFLAYQKFSQIHSKYFSPKKAYYREWSISYYWQ